ncbi:unnamed protein product [Rotaria socialis]|uniref:Uncharacterized protein n=1 Tax=Rotaria socialis TaxID=392032 RepID=A0A817X8E1_9BILA|nr:unnamed protein product [Rotaria socialis]
MEKASLLESILSANNIDRIVKDSHTFNGPFACCNWRVDHLVIDCTYKSAIVCSTTNKMTTITQLEDLSNEIFLGVGVFYSTSGNLLCPKQYNQRKQLRQFQDAIPGHDILNVATITKVVRQAYNAAAADRLSCFKVKNFLNTKKITNIKEANNCMESSLRKRVNIQDYSDFNEEDEPSDSENESDEMFDSESDVDREDQQYEASTISSDGLFGDLDGIKFSGRGVFGKVLEKSDLNWKSIGRKNVKTNKQTACWIVTQNKSVLSNDGVTRAIQK